MATTTPPTTSSDRITLRLPYKYSHPSRSSPPPQTIPFPPLDFLHRIWSVTHSTLSMWRSARNVRITYKPLSPTTSTDSRPRIDDLVEYESLSGSGSVKTVAGIDTGNWDLANIKDDTTSWDWRGSGWLFFVSSHWEVLGWGERKNEETGEVEERWVVTWFAPTLFTKEGVDVYSDRKEGGNRELVEEVLRVLEEVLEEGGERTKQLREMVERDMREVAISLPWKER